YKYDEASEILVENGKFKTFGKNLGEADEVIDLGGALVLPPYVDAHIHLDHYLQDKTVKSKTHLGRYLKQLIYAMIVKTAFKKKRNHVCVKQSKTLQAMVHNIYVLRRIVLTPI